jgi:hypothetical protein
MDIDKVRGLLTYEVIPSFFNNLGKAETQYDLESVSHKLLTQLVELVFPTFRIVLKMESEEKMLSQHDDEDNFVMKILKCADKYGE